MQNYSINRHTKSYSFAFLLIVFLILEQGYGLISLPRYIFFILLGLFFLFQNKSSFSKPISFFIYSCIFSIFSCMIFRNENPIDIIGEYNVYLMIIFYFVLCKYNINISKIEKVLFWGFIIFCFCYLYQVSVFPKAVFLNENNRINESLDITNRRIRIVGMSINSFGYFYCLNKILEKRKVFIIPLGLSIICMLLFGFRTLLFFTAIFSFIMLIRFYGFTKKLILSCLFGAACAYFLFLTPLFQTVFEAMMERQETASFDNKDYIRYYTLYHYYTNHFKNVFEMFFGSGFCNRMLNTPYSLEIVKNESMGLHYYDWGLLGISWMTGVLSLIGMLWWSIKAAFTKLPNNFLYLSIWFAFILTCAFTSAEFVRQGCFLLQSICLYLIYKISSNEKNSCNK